VITGYAITLYALMDNLIPSLLSQDKHPIGILTIDLEVGMHDVAVGDVRDPRVLVGHSYLKGAVRNHVRDSRH
jgi:hypothetical protein